MRKVLLIVIAIMALCGCSPRIIEQEVVKHDTTYIDRLRHDSIYKHDSIYVHEYQKGDTIYVDRDRWHYGWRERVIRDSIYITQRDTITTTEIREVERELSGWQWFQIWAGRIAFALVGLLVIYLIIKH